MFTITKQDINSILRDYSINAECSSFTELQRYYYEKEDSASKQVRLIVKTDLTNGCSLVMRFKNEDDAPQDVIEAQSQFAVLMFVIMFSTYSLNMLFYLLYGDIYKEDSKRNLERLALLLSTVNVNTSYNLLEESECYYRKYKFKFNKDKILQVLESKYILVPVYDTNGDTKKVSILQEHVVGSKEYVLSMGSPKRALVPVLSQSS